MIIGRLLLARAVKLPLGTWRRGTGVAGRRRCVRRANGTLALLRGRIWFEGQHAVRSTVRRSRAHLGIQLIFPHYISKRKKNARKKQHEKKEPDHMPPFQYAFPHARSPARPHLLSLPSQTLHPAINNLYGQRKHNRCVLLDTYF